MGDLQHLEAVFVRSAKPAEDKPNVYTFRLSDGETDRYKTRFAVAGWKLDAFNANPVIFLGHEWQSDETALPIGRGRAYIADNALMLDVEFDHEDPEACRVERKVVGGFVRAVSVGARPLRWADTRAADGASECLEQELWEASIVSLPANPRALRVRDAGVDVDAIVERVAARLAGARPIERSSSSVGAVAQFGREFSEQFQKYLKEQ